MNDYKFGTKNNWRRWLWNALAERCAIPRYEALVLYLAAEQDLDRAIACSKGFSPANMIAVERDPERLAAQRAQGRLVVDGDIIDVAACWPPRQPLSVICMDFCCGLELDVVSRLVNTVAIQPMQTVVALNFLRGRDASTNTLRAEIGRIRRDGYGWSETKHRGRIFWDVYAASMYTRFAQSHTGEEMPSEDGIAKKNAAINLAVSFWFEHAKPAFMSYRSQSGQTFDSVVFNTWGASIADRADSGFAAAWRKALSAQVVDATAVQRRIAAVLAHRTRRMADVAA